MSLINRRTRTRTEERHVPDTATPTTDERIAQLRAESDELIAAEAADPITGAKDLPAWHERTRQRGERQVEIERRIRELREYGDLVDLRPEQVNIYAHTARPIQAHFARLNETRILPSTSDGDSNGDRLLIRWWSELMNLAQQLPHDDPTKPGAEAARTLLAREFESWMTARNSWVLARSVWNGGAQALPSPELGLEGGTLPSWLGYGAYRHDT